MDSNYIYLGLEGIKRSEKTFDGALIRVVYKKSLTILNTMWLDSLQVNSVQALLSGDDGTLWGVDKTDSTFLI